MESDHLGAVVAITTPNEILRHPVYEAVTKCANT